MTWNPVKVQHGENVEIDMNGDPMAREKDGWGRDGEKVAENCLGLATQGLYQRLHLAPNDIKRSRHSLIVYKCTTS